MTPFYVVIQIRGDGSMPLLVTHPITTQKEALDTAEVNTRDTGDSHYVMECIAKVELPVPQPIITMKGD